MKVSIKFLLSNVVGYFWAKFDEFLDKGWTSRLPKIIRVEFRSYSDEEVCRAFFMIVLNSCLKPNSNLSNLKYVSTDFVQPINTIETRCPLGVSLERERAQGWESNEHVLVSTQL